MSEESEDKDKEGELSLRATAIIWGTIDGFMLLLLVLSFIIHFYPDSVFVQWLINIPVIGVIFR